MKKNRFTEFFKGKGYYVLLFVGVLAIAAVALIGSNLSYNRGFEGEDFVDLNEPDNNIAAVEDNNQLAENNSNTQEVAENNNANQNQAANANTNENTNQNVANNDDLLEFDVFTEVEESGIDLANAANAEEITQDEPEAVETTGTTVKADNSSILSFQADDGLLWPVDGNIIMNYSMDHTIYHATLMQFKCNPAIIIDAEIGTEVKAAAKGIIESIDNNEVTGLTVTTNIGDGFQLVYGQLKDVNLKVGDKINEGQIIGYVQKPTKYYSVEGSNLYFKVLEEDKTVNPMLYLR